MTRTGYAFGMSATPSDPDHINPKALEGFMRAFDRVINAKYGVGSVEPQTAELQTTDPQAESMLNELEMQVVKTVMRGEQAVPVKLRPARLRFWYKFALLRKHLSLEG